jgi:hypothetical protein
MYRVINRHGYPLRLDAYDCDGSLESVTKLKAELDAVGFDDEPFTIIRKGEIPSWVTDVEALDQLREGA